MLTIRIREYIFIFLTATIFCIVLHSKSFSDENIFVVDNIEVEGVRDLNFSRDIYIDKAFLNSFEILKSRILLSKDLNKIRNIKLSKIKNLINNFQIVDETYQKDVYKATFKIFYNDFKLKKFLGEKNISFSQTKTISAVFFPILFVNDEIKDFNENYFYTQWEKVKIENELINFILPLDDLDDISKIKEMKNKVEELEVGPLVNKYNIKSYVFALMNYQNSKLNVYLKTNFGEDVVSKNISYDLNNINDEMKLNLILKDLKMQISDIWKEENIINILMPLSIKIKFQHKNLIELDKLIKTFYKVNIIDNYFLEEINIDHSFFKIHYYGNPKRLKTELSKYDYYLKDDQGHWELSYK